MSTAAKINIHDEGEHVFSIDRTYDGYPAIAGADLLSALYQREQHGNEDVIPDYGGRNPAHRVASRVVSVSSDHVLCPLGQWRGYEYVYEIHASTGAVLIAKREDAGEWKDGPNLDGAEVYKPIEADTDGYRPYDKRHQLATFVNEERRRANGSLLISNLEAGEQQWEHMRKVGPLGQDTDEKAPPLVSDDVATWVNPDTGELTGRSLVAKEPRVTINEENEPSPSELAARNGERALIDWHGRQAVTEGGTVCDLSERQMQELAKAYKSARSRQRRKA